MPKLCTKCKEIKAESAFGYRPERGGRYRSHCKECAAASYRAWVAANPDKARLAAKRWQASNPDSVRRIEQRKRWKRDFSITLEEGIAILEAQGYRCANPSCDVPLTWGRGRYGANLDHCHKNNVIRGFLCASCNKALGYVGDDVNKLSGLIQYLEKSSAQIPRTEIETRVPQ